MYHAEQLKKQERLIEENKAIIWVLPWCNRWCFRGRIIW